MSWQNYLQEDLASRQAKNPKYSLRSYASTVGLSPSHLSSILSGKRKVASRTAFHLAKTLGVTPTETLEWLDEKPKLRKGNGRRMLNVEEFRLISEWYYYAILGLSNLKSNRACPYWIANKIRISPALAQSALSNLEKAGYVKIEGDRFYQATPPLRTQDDTPSSLIRRYHKQVMELASRQLENAPVERREFNSMCLAIDPKRLKAAKKMLREFKERFSEELSGGNKKDVYYFAMQLFPVTEE